MVRIFIAILICCLSVQGWSEDATKQIKSLIKEFEQAQPNSSERFVAASLLHMHGILDKDKMNKLGLSAQEFQAVEKAEKEVAGITALSKELESKLTPADVIFITTENPKSFYRVTGKYPMVPDMAGCTASKYENLKKQVDLAELYTKGTQVMAYIPAAEMSFSKNYQKALSELITKDSRFKNYQPLLKTVLNEKNGTQVMERSGLSALTSAFPNEGRLKRYEDALIKSGVKPNETQSYAFKMAQLSPECLGTINKNFITWTRQDFVRSQLNKFSQRLAGQTLTAEDITDGLFRFIDEKDPYLNTTRDPWGNKIEISKIGPNQIVLISKFSDYKTSDDDIRSAPISVRFK